MTNKELEAKVINAQSAVAKREAVLAKHREQLAKLIAKGADQYDIGSRIPGGRLDTDIFGNDCRIAVYPGGTNGPAEFSGAEPVSAL